jgi:hypothetical protein
MPSTGRKLELKEKTSIAQTVSQPCVYAKGLRRKEGAPEKKIHKKEKKGTDMVE